MKPWLIREPNLIRNTIFVYPFLGLLGIPVFAQLMRRLNLDLTRLMEPQILKSGGLILLTSGLLYVLMRWSLRQRTKEALQRSEERFQKLAANMPGVIYQFQLRPDGSYTFPFVSPSCRQIYELEAEQIQQNATLIIDIIHPSDRQSFDESVMVSAHTLEPWRWEGRIITHTGKLKWLQIASRPELQVNGDIVWDGLLMDITERKQMEEALRQSQQQLTAILEYSPAAVYLKDAQGRYLLMNRKCATSLPVDPEHYYGKTDYDILPESIADAFRKNDQAVLTGGITTESEEVVPIEEGFRTYFSVKFPLYDSTGVPYAVCGISTDITERKRVEEALRQSEERFRQLAENTDQVFWMRSAENHQMLYISPAYEKIWGRSCTSLYEQPNSWIETIHPEDRNRVMAAIVKQLWETFDEEYRIIRPDQSVRWLRNRAFPIKDTAGHIYRIAGIAEDITTRKRSEEEVRFLQAMKQAVFESEDFHAALRVAIQKVCEATSWDFGEAWVPSSDGTVLECSPAWYSCSESLTAFRRASEQLTFSLGVGLPGRVWLSRQPEWRRDVSIESNQIYQRAQIATECGLKAGLGIPLIANDGVIAVLVFYMFESRDEDQRLIELISASTELGLFIQRKQAEEEVRQSLERERELSELKSRFISMTSHEFRTPLSTILLSAGTLENYGAKLTEDKKLQHLGRIKSSVARMTRLLEDVLLIGKVEAGKLEFKPIPFNLEKFCSELVEEIQLNDGSQHQINFVKQGLRTQTCMDEKLLQHILSNLLSNAIKYSTPSSTIDFEAICQDDHVIFKVKDQGIGIPLEDRLHLFETFHRATNVGTISGTGLGLAIVKKAVDLHGGQISVESELGLGTTFTVALPLNNRTETSCN